MSFSKFGEIPQPHSSPILQLPFSPVLGVAELAELLKKTPTSVLLDHSRAPHRLPPSCEPPGTKHPLWLLDEVLDWLRQHQVERVKAGARRKKKKIARAHVQAELVAPEGDAHGSPRRGASSKAERVEAARLGITVRDLRARKSGAA